MFESIQDSLSSALKTLRGKGKLTEANMREGLGLVQNALLEADVSFAVVKDFMQRVTDEALGEKVLKALDPTQHLIGIVHQELVSLMGPVDSSIPYRAGALTTIMLCGLQGSGKTTTTAKLARLIQRDGHKPMLVAADLQRPAAIQQLHVLGESIGVPVYSETGAADPVLVCQNAVKRAKSEGADVLILDTAGRLHIDDELMDQLKRIDNRVSPDLVMLVVDGMTGQDAVNSAKAFDEAIELDGVILTKLDGDARGGAVLSVKAVTGVPVKFIGVGEQTDALEEFRPEGMAERILGMGDVVGLFNLTKEKFDQQEMLDAEEKMRKGEFTLDDFRKQLGQIRKLGPLQKIMGMLPGMGQIKDLMGSIDAEKDMARLFGIIDSMTQDERRNPSKVIDQSRRRRIAAGAGVQPHEVNELVKQFDTMSGVMKDLAGKGLMDRAKAIKGLQQGGMLNPAGLLGRSKQGTGKRLTADERKKLKKERERALRKKNRDGRSK